MINSNAWRLIIWLFLNIVDSAWELNWVLRCTGIFMKMVFGIFGREPKREKGVGWRPLPDCMYHSINYDYYIIIILRWLQARIFSFLPSASRSVCRGLFIWVYFCKVCMYYIVCTYDKGDFYSKKTSKHIKKSRLLVGGQNFLDIIVWTFEEREREREIRFSLTIANVWRFSYER